MLCWPSGILDFVLDQWRAEEFLDFVLDQWRAEEFLDLVLDEWRSEEFLDLGLDDPISIGNGANMGPMSF